MADQDNRFTLRLEQQQGFQFLVSWDSPDVPELLVDEPAPLGHDTGPSPSRMLVLAVGNCLAASLLFSLRKFKNQSEPIRASITGELVRNEHNRLRIGHVEVELQMGAAADQLQHLDRVLEQFEDFCVVTESVRHGFPVAVTVRDGSGTIVKQGGMEAPIEG
ncbi:OsmC family protein [Chitinivorax sp. PXF-14]|uniref:OsmC family protein n=1 Tax=Chitinivorax sp. PXF-14 TaxID=3230488 RepID=UPI003467590C